MLFLEDGQKLDFVDRAFRGLAGWLCQLIYRIIAGLFELFINISKVEVLNPNGPEIKQIYQRITMMLTIIMVFYVMFEFIKFIIEPDQMTDKEKGAENILKKMVIMVALLAFVPNIFSSAYRLQDAIIDRQVISKLIMGKEGIDGTNFGRSFSANILHEFYRYDEDYWGDHDGKNNCVCEKKLIGGYDCTVSCKAIVNANLNSLAQDGDLPMLTTGLGDGAEHPTSTGEDILTPYITFDGLFAVGVGCFLIYILVLYCIDVGTRVFQLLFLQIIAPIPIIGYLSPKKDNIFTKWVKQCATTYLDLFLRLAIIYFILFLCQILSVARQNGQLFANLNISSGTSKTLVYIALIMGLLLFAQRAPKLLQELFPKLSAAASGNLGLKAGERVAPMAARALGVGLGATRVGLQAGVARARNVRKRNKDLKDKLRSEGKHVDRKSMREARREARKQERETKRGYDARTRQLDKADKDLANAEREEKRKAKELENAKKSGNAERIEDATAAYKKAQAATTQAKERYDTIRKGTNVNVRETVREAKDREDRARTALDAAVNERQRRINNGEYDRMTEAEKAQMDNDIKQKQEAYRNAANEHREAKRMEDTMVSQSTRQNLKDALQARENARRSGEYNDPEKRKQFDEAVANAEAKYDSELKTGYEASRRNYDDAKSELAKQRNQTYGAFAGVQGIGAAIAGAATGAMAGGKATKLEDIRKNVSEGVKKANASAAATNQYLQDGGSATLSGTIDRTVAHVQQQMGIRTESDRIKEEIKHIEDQAKSIGMQATLEGSLATAKSEAEDRSRSKIEKGEQKIMVVDALKNVMGPDGRTVLINWAEEMPDYMNNTTSDVYQHFEAKEASLTAQAEAANQAVTRAIAAGASADSPEVKRLQEEANKLAKQAETAKKQKTAALKALGEYGVTKAIQGDTTDPTLASKAANIQAAIENNINNARSRQEVIARLQKKIEDARSQDDKDKFQAILDAFNNNAANDFDTVDKIEGILSGHVNELNIQKNQLQERVNDIQRNSNTDAANAAAAGSGKK